MMERPRHQRTPHNANFQKLIEIAAHRFGMGDQLHSIRICHEARKILSKYFPDKTVGDFPQLKIISYKEGALNISAANSSLLHQLSMKKHLIQTELNSQFTATTIKKINLRSQS